MLNRFVPGILKPGIFSTHRSFANCKNCNPWKMNIDLNTDYCAIELSVGTFQRVDIICCRYPQQRIQSIIIMINAWNLFDSGTKKYIFRINMKLNPITHTFKWTLYISHFITIQFGGRKKIWRVGDQTASKCWMFDVEV